jgi:hypothetical protein
MNTTLTVDDPLYSSDEERLILKYSGAGQLSVRQSDQKLVPNFSICCCSPIPLIIAGLLGYRRLLQTIRLQRSHGKIHLCILKSMT